MISEVSEGAMYIQITCRLIFNTTLLDTRENSDAVHSIICSYTRTEENTKVNTCSCYDCGVTVWSLLRSNHWSSLKMPRQSKIFVAYRALGFVSNHIPLSLRYINRRNENLVVTSVGKSFHTYSVSYRLHKYFERRYYCSCDIYGCNLYCFINVSKCAL